MLIPRPFFALRLLFRSADIACHNELHSPLLHATHPTRQPFLRRLLKKSFTRT